MARTIVPVTDATPTKASLTTALTGTNNDLIFTAKSGGQWGNSIQVEYHQHSVNVTSVKPSRTQFYRWIKN
jgi:hypothetical protein